MYGLVLQVVEPYTLLLFALVICHIVAYRASAARGRTFWVTTALLATMIIISTPWFAYVAMGSLEWRYPPNTLVPGREDVIVVLSGNFIPEDETCQKYRLGSETVDRCLEAANWYKQGSGCRVLVSGGKIAPGGECPAIAEVMREFLVQQGIAADDITVEDQSTTTAENAKFSAPLLAENKKGKIFLITSANHMPRSVACFSKAGISVIATPGRRNAAVLEFTIGSFIPSARAMSQTCQAAHEWTGYAWYWLTGRV